MPAVDRNVLRIGVFEMRDPADPSPPAVVINEAIELARRYGSADSPSFVNGVLDQIKNQESVVSGLGPVASEEKTNLEDQTPTTAERAPDSIDSESSSLTTDN
jgi:hypothetical protein